MKDTNTAKNTLLSNPKLSWIGRFQESENGEVNFTWPGSALAFNFRGSQLSLPLSSSEPTRFLVELDGKSRTLWVGPETKPIVLAQNLNSGEHRLRLTRETESFSIVSSIAGPPVVDGSLLNAPHLPERKLLFIGDSITAGYGVEGRDQHCGYDHASSTVLKSYAALATEKLNAQSHYIAWSGIGAWRSYGEQKAERPTILERYSRTLADDPSSQWSPLKYQAQAIVLAIGTNDFWDGPAPGYAAAIKKQVALLLADYPKAKLYLMLSPMLKTELRELQKAALQPLLSEQVKLLDLGRIEVNEGYGCDWHPSEATQQKLSVALVQVLSQDLSW